MWLYWLIFAIPAIAAIIERPTVAVPLKRRDAPSIAWVGFGLGLILFIGFRYEVGGDWFNYLRMLWEIQGTVFSEAIFQSDPSYRLLNLISTELGWNIIGVNIAGSIIFVTGLVRFCRTQPRPWLACTVAVPYLVIVVAMGYSRQGIALGLVFHGLVALGNGRSVVFLTWVVIAATFHKSAVLLLPIAALAGTNNKKMDVVLGLFMRPWLVSPASR